MKKIITLILVILIIGSGIFYSKQSSFPEKEIILNNSILEIQDGEILKSLSQRLGVNYLFLKNYVNNNHPDFELQIGNYEMKKGYKIDDVIISLQNPITNERNITFLEGWNIFDYDSFLTEAGLISEGDFIKYAENTEKIESLAEFFPFIKGLSTLEGFLYPDTYKIDASKFAINTLVIKMLENFEMKVYEKILKKYDATTILDVMTLASIVQKEAHINHNSGNYSQVPMIAGILKKRLNEGWALGADITVCYPYQLTSQECTPAFIGQHVNVDKNDYNTRTKTGLPKTPINNPEYEVINATINDKKSPHYYYLHDTITGKIYYGSTNAEHESNKRKYMR